MNSIKVELKNGTTYTFRPPFNGGATARVTNSGALEVGCPHEYGFHVEAAFNVAEWRSWSGA